MTTLTAMIHPDGPGTVLWIHDGILDSHELSDNEGQASHDDFWNGGYDSCGRIDDAWETGSMVFGADVGRRKARRIAEDVFAAFPGVRFRVTHGFGYSYQETSVRLFWEATE